MHSLCEYFSIDVVRLFYFPRYLASLIPLVTVIAALVGGLSIFIDWLAFEKAEHSIEDDNGAGRILLAMLVSVISG